VALRLEGFTVEGASDGQEGLQKAVELLPDSIITDLSMPIIIACTSEEAPSGTHDSRADTLLTKPCPRDTLLLEVRQLLAA